MSAFFPNVCANQNPGGRVVGVAGPTHVLCESGPCYYVRGPPCLQSDDNMRVSCATVRGSECYRCLPENCGGDNSRGVLIQIRGPMDTVCIPGGVLHSNNCNGRVTTICREAECRTTCP